MTMTATDAVEEHSGDGSTVEFAYAFPIRRKEELVVIIEDDDADESVQLLDVDYSVAGVGDATGTITFTTAPLATDTIHIYRETKEVLDLGIIQGKRYFQGIYESALDHLARFYVDIQDRLDRVVKFKVSGDEADDGDDPLTEATAWVADTAAAEAAAEAERILAEGHQSDAETAQGLAEDAQGFAEDAQGLAEDAQGLAEDAQGLAEDARDLAEIAKNAAVVHQGAASDAEDAAVSHQADAESAQSDTETAASILPTISGGDAGKRMQVNAAEDAFELGVFDIDNCLTNTYNVGFNAFRISAANDFVLLNMDDGIVDDYQDETGVDTGNTDLKYLTSVDLYTCSADYTVIHSNGSILDETCAAFAAPWTDASGAGGSTGQVTYDGEETFYLAVTAAGTGSAEFKRTDIVFDIGTYWVEFETYFTSLGTREGSNESLLLTLGLNNSATDQGRTLMYFGSDAVEFKNTAAGYVSIGNLVVTGVWQNWVLKLTLLGAGPGGGALADIYLDGYLVANNIDVFDTFWPGDNIIFRQYNAASATRTNYINLIRVGAAETFDGELTSAAFTADAATGFGELIFVAENNDEAMVANTNILAYASNDNGVTWDAITLSSLATFTVAVFGTLEIFGGEVTFTGSDTGMKYKIEIADSKVLLHGAAFFWRE